MITKNQLDLIKRLEGECKEFEKRRPRTQTEASDYINYLKTMTGRVSHFHRSFMRGEKTRVEG